MRKLLLAAAVLSIALFAYPEDVSADCNNLIGVSAKCYTSEGSSQYALWMTLTPTMGYWCPGTIVSCNPGWNCVGGVCGWYATYSQTGIPAGTTWGVTDGTGTRYTSSSSSISVRYQMAGGTVYLYDGVVSGGSGTQYGCATGCGQLSGSPSISSSAPSVTAGYNTEYYLTTSSSSGGTVSPSSAWYASGSSVTLTATPNSGYVFSSWSGDASGSTNPVTITMNGPKTVTANFVLATCNLPWGGTIKTDKA